MSVAIARPVEFQKKNIRNVVVLPTFRTGQAAYEQGDYATAKAVWSTLARHGDAEGCYYLGTLYDEGKGVRADAGKAIKWYQRAACHGYVSAHTHLAGMYLHGDGVARNFGKALEHYRAAAERGEEIAAYFLGVLYLEGHPVTLNDSGVPRDAMLALAWFRRAADAGLIYAQRKLEELRARGIG